MERFYRSSSDPWYVISLRQHSRQMKSSSASTQCLSWATPIGSSLFLQFSFLLTWINPLICWNQNHHLTSCYLNTALALPLRVMRKGLSHLFLRVRLIVKMAMAVPSLLFMLNIQRSYNCSSKWRILNFQFLPSEQFAHGHLKIEFGPNNWRTKWQTSLSLFRH